MANIVFLKTAWMDYYDGRKSDKIIGNHKYVKKNKKGAEDRNFSLKGKVAYGYAPVFTKLHFDEHFDVKPDDEYITATIIWIAKAPGNNRGVVVVGWYKNARLYRKMQNRYGRSFIAEALSKNCKRIDSDDRDYQIVKPPVMAAVWYAPGRTALKNDMEKLIAGKLEPKIIRKRGPVDIPRRLQVEIAAIKKITDDFEDDGFKVDTVEKENCGWDLTATRGSLELRLEVKGASGATVQADLSPNEYGTLLKNFAAYRICIVTSALSKPTPHVFSYRPATKEWRDKPGKRVLKVTKLVGARVRG